MRLAVSIMLAGAAVSALPLNSPLLPAYDYIGKSVMLELASADQS